MASSSLCVFVSMLMGCAETPRTGVNKGDSEPPVPKLQVHIAFRVTQDIQGAPLRGSIGGLEEADAICQFYGRSVHADESYRAFLAHGEPLYADHRMDESVSIQDRIELKSPIFMYTDREEPVELVPDPSQLWTDCEKLKNFLRSVDRNPDFEIIEDADFPWTGIQCDGSPAYFSCNAWKGSPPADSSNLNIDDMSLETNYFLHQRLGTKGTDPNSQIPCTSTGSIICVSILD